MTSSTHHIEQALAAMRADRERLDRAIASLEQTLRLLELDEVDTSTSLHVKPTRGDRRLPVGMRSIRDVVMDIANNGEAFGLPDVMAALAEEGNTAQYESVSSIVSRLHREGVFEKLGRGTYRLPAKIAEGPASAEPSDPIHRAVAATAVPERGEVVGDGADDRDHHRHPAPVTGGN